MHKYGMPIVWTSILLRKKDMTDTYFDSPTFTYLYIRENMSVFKAPYTRDTNSYYKDDNEHTTELLVW
jgi:hypothetical protein